GVMQVMPETRDWVEQVILGHSVPHTLDGDIEVGVLYLRHLLGRFDGDTRLALAAWYQGDAAVREFGLFEMTKPFVADVLALPSRMSPDHVTPSGRPLGVLMAEARAVRGARSGRMVTYSRKVFIPLTKLSGAVCPYSTFPRPPRRGERAYLTVDE